MNPVETFGAGIAPGHLPAMVAGLVALAWLTASGWLRSAPGTVDRWAAVLLGTTAAIHLALPLGHGHGGPGLTLGFLASGAAYGWLAWRAGRGRQWRLAAAPLVVATLVGYLAVVGGGEEADQVGIATGLVELAVLGLALVPARHVTRPRRLARFAGSAATVTATFLFGAAVWGASLSAHDAAAAAGADEHGHADHASRAQAGMIMRPDAGHHDPTGDERAAADRLATQTVAAVERYADLDAALADGYRTTFQSEGTGVHLEHKEHQRDGRTLDPDRPEMLVYAIRDGRATLLGVVYVMDTAGRPGPAPGGPITRWHAHNACLTVLPPGLGLVTPYGNCPAFSVTVGTSEMMHVWVVDNPGGRFAHGLDEQWVAAYHAEHGRPYRR